MIIFFFWLLFIITHLLFLTSIPIFEDEALYLFLADKISQNPLQYFFIYPQNGLLPMFGWLISLLNLFFHDSLIAGRVLNVLLTSTLIFWIVKISQLYDMKKHFIFISIALLIVSPIIHLNTRVALLDTSVLVFTSWYIYFTAKYLQSSKFPYFIFLLLCALAAFLTKATAIFGVFPVLFLIYLDFKSQKKFYFKKYIKLLIVFFIVLSVSGSLFLFFGSQITADSGSSLITHQSASIIFNKIKTNLWLTYHWAVIYYLPFFLLPILFLIFYKKVQKYKFYLLMFIWLLSSIIFMITLNRFYYPRHILLLSLPLIVFASAFICEIPKKIGITFLFFLIILRLQLGWDIVTQISKSSIALEDKFEYFENYTSGSQLPAIASTLRKTAQGQPTTVWVDGSYIMEYGLRREMKNDPVTFKSFRLKDNFLADTPIEVFADRGKKTFVITNRWEPKNISKLELIKSFNVSFRHSQNLYIIP